MSATKRKLSSIGVLLCFFMLFTTSVFAAAAQPESYTLTVIHTNDFHDYDPYALARKATLIKEIRTQTKNVLLLDAGDLYARGPYHKLFYGQMEMDVYNALKYDAWELGNNEFKGHPDQAIADQKLYSLIRQANFPTLCANIKTTGGEYLPGTDPYTYKEVNGMKIGIIGVSSMKVKGYPQASNKLVEDPVATVSSLIPEVRQNSDIQLVLSHAGLSADVNMDMRLADSGISLIIGADDHYVIKQPIYRSGGIPIVQAGGENNMYLGRIDLTYQHKNGKWVLISQQGEIIPITDNIPMDTQIKQIIDQYLATVQKPAA